MIILDDNEKMWAKFKENYLHTKPYVFFQENETKNQQGINQDVESQARVYNPHDYWLFTASKSLE
jgi:RNA polymerase II subunit A-like phosphatase